MRTVDCSPDYHVFSLNNTLYAFLVEGALLLKLDRDSCFDGNLLSGDFIQAMALLEEHLRAADGTPRAIGASCNCIDNTVSALNLNLTDKCTLNCIYCYASGGDYSRITDDMDFATFEKAMNDIQSVIDPNRQFRFEFFGGEPLMNPQMILKVLEWEKTQTLTDKPIINRISTSLTTLSDELEDALVAGNFIVSISLDGGRETQNIQRPFKSGGGTFDHIIDNVRRLKKRNPDIVTVARMTAWKNAHRLCQEIDELVSLNLFDYCSIYSAAIETEDGGKLYMSDEYKKSYLAFASQYNDYLEDDRNIFKGCLELNRFIGHILQGTAALNHCRAGNGYFTLSPDASVHPCHRFIGDASMAIDGGLKNVGETPDFWKKTVNERDECSRCLVRYFCGGGCKQENLISTGSPLGVSDKNCEFAQLLFDAGIIAVDSLSEKSIEKLSGIFEKSTDLFVLCGQNVEHTDRPALKAIVQNYLGEFMA